MASSIGTYQMKAVTFAFLITVPSLISAVSTGNDTKGNIIKDMQPVAVEFGKEFNVTCNVTAMVDKDENIDLLRVDKTTAKWVWIHTSSRHEGSYVCTSRPNECIHNLGNHSFTYIYKKASFQDATDYKCIGNVESNLKNTTVVVMKTPTFRSSIIKYEGMGNLDCEMYYAIPKGMSDLSKTPSMRLILNNKTLYAKVDRLAGHADIEISMRFTTKEHSRKQLVCSAYTDNPGFTLNITEHVIVVPKAVPYVVGGIVLVCGIVLIGFLLWRFQKNNRRQSESYHLLNGDGTDVDGTSHDGGDQIALNNEELLALAKLVKNEIKQSQVKLLGSQGIGGTVGKLTFIGHMSTLMVLQEDDLEKIKAKDTESEKAAELIRHLLRCSPHNIILFVWILVDMDQFHQLPDSITKDIKDYMKSQTKEEICGIVKTL